MNYSRLLSLIAFSMMACANLNAAVTLDDISYSSMPGDKVQISLKFSEALSSEPVNFTIDNPARIAVDLPGVSLNLAERNQSIGIGMAHSLAAVEAGGRTRVVVNLVRPVSYEISSEGNLVLMTLGAGVGAAPAAASAAAQPALGARETSGGDAGRIEAIDFRRGEGGEGRIIVTLSDPSVGVNLGQESGQIVADFMSTNLPAELDRRLDVVDFATPVKEIDTSSVAGGTRMLISTVTDQYDHMAYQSGNLFTIEVRPLTQEEKQAQEKEKFGYTGERLSLNFQNIEVRAVLQLIADFTGFNLVATDTVSGSVTLRLRNVPWDQVLDIILKAKGLAVRKDGNVMLVAPTEEIAAREKLELESQQQVTELSPLRTDFIQINYAKASDLASLIQGSESKLLSGRGNVTIDDRTNTLIIQDVATSLEAIRNMIAKLDIPVRQVMIESRIVNADESFSRDLGVQFGYSKRSVDAMTNNGTATVGSDAIFDLEPTADDFLVNLPVAGTSGIGFAVGKVGSYLLQLELSALLAEGRGEDIANPKIITANKTTATIESGVQIPYQEATSSGATSTSFQKAVLSLKVTPQITPDDRIILDLTVNQDSQGASTQSGIPIINTKNVTTQVLVNDGETVVLGGVYTQVDRNDSDRVPFFGDLPYVGFLFKNSRIRNTRNELLIFVTPRILSDDLKI